MGTMAPSPHSTRATIVNRSGSSSPLSAYNNRPTAMNHHSASDKHGAYSALSATLNQQIGSEKISAYGTRSAATTQISSSSKLSAYDISSVTGNQQSFSDMFGPYDISAVTGTYQSFSEMLNAPDIPSFTSSQQTSTKKLSAYEISSVTRSRYRDVLHVGQHSISREDECLDDDCGSFCQGSKDKSSKTDLDCSKSDFSLNMEGVMNAFGPFTRGRLTPIPEHAVPSHSSRTGVPSKSSQTAGPSLRDLELGTINSTVTTTDPELIVYPDLKKRVERYFETLKPAPAGWTWSIDDAEHTNRSYAPTQSTNSFAMTDASTIASGSVTELSQAGPSRPPTPQMALAQMDRPQMDRPQMDHSQMNHLQMELTRTDALTGWPNKPLDPMAEISIRRQLQTQIDGIQPFGPSRFLSHPDGNPTANPNGNYLGTMSAASNQMTSLPDHLNTCIWVEGAPGDLTYYEMLRSIRHCGKVYSVHINPPKEKHYTAAAKIAFCTRVGAERFFQQAHSALGIVIRGRRLCIRWNRNKYRENYNRSESRVLRISGDARYVNFQVLGEYFARLFYFNLIWVEELAPGDMIWEFSSILAQAHSAKQAIEREPAMMHVVHIQYQRDPCE